MSTENYYNQHRQQVVAELDLETIVSHLENNFADQGAGSLGNYQDAREWYEMILHNAGEIAANFIAPRAAAVDEKGATFKDGEVEWADETKENMKVLSEAGYMGGTLERKYGGLNLPTSINNVIVEMVSQADASLMNLYGLQDIATTLQRFGDDEQKDRILPLFASGKVSGSMDLTEPDAGSDLQTVKLKAIQKDGKWYLDGVKRFITNGSADVHLVLARTEEGSKDGRGLSMMLYERDEHMVIRRIEDKLGIHGSPTCELQFNMAPCELIGKRRFGLIKYMMSLLNGARLATTAQALGIAQAAYEEAVKYANEREQFDKKIIHFPAVYQMLKKMEAEIETSRLLLYHTARAVDIEEMYQHKLDKGEKVKPEYKKASNLASFLTPLSKFVITELANKVAYDSLQIHGGCGYMKDFPIERLYRDARITNIYEGTTQLQVVAAIGAITSGLFAGEMEKLESLDISHLQKEQSEIIEFASSMNQLVTDVLKVESKEFKEFVGNYLVEMASILYRLYLYLPFAEKHESKRNVLKFYLVDAKARLTYLEQMTRNLIAQYGSDIDTIKKDFLL
jgi:alkylation response protein AidB-like acyl-CoA dehydrogenase